MPTEVIIENPVLDGRNSATDIKELFVPTIGDGDKERIKFYLGHGVEQMKTHGGLQAGIKINYDEKDAWGAVGSSLGKTFNRLVGERGEPTFGVGRAVIPFGGVVSVVGVKRSENPKVQLYFGVGDLYRESDKRIAPKVRAYLEDFLTGYALERGVDIHALSALAKRFQDDGSVPYGGSLADLHHRIESTFKALGNAERQDKAIVTIGLGGDPLEPRIGEQTLRHGEATLESRVNLDGSGKANLDLTSLLDAGYLKRFGDFQEILTQRAKLDQTLSGESMGIHHTIEDFGIPQGKAFYQAVSSNPRRLVRFGHDVYTDDDKFVLATVGVSNRYSFVGDYSRQLMSTDDIVLHYLEQMLTDAKWEAYLHVGKRDFERMDFKDSKAIEILHKVLTPGSEYGIPSNEIIPYEDHLQIEDPAMSLFYVLGGAIRMGTRIDRSQPEGVASSKGITY